MLQPAPHSSVVVRRGLPGFAEERASRTQNMTKRSLVCIVDDNESVRESLPDLVRHGGYDVQTFASAEEFLKSPALEEATCLILDVGLPGMSGPDLHRELMRRGRRFPVVFITAQGDKSLPARMVAAGAVACLLKPFGDTALLDALQRACGRS